MATRRAPARTPRTSCATSASSRRGRTEERDHDAADVKLYQVGTLRGRQPAARPGRAHGPGQHGSLELAHLRAPRLPGLRRGARRPLRARRRHARDRRQARSPPTRPAAWRSSRRRTRSPRGSCLAALAVRQRPGGRDRHRGRAEGARAATTSAWSARQATAAPSTSASAASPACSSANDDVLFVCYDNEGYMNTGVQRSGATPPAARTANTKPVGAEPGNVFGQGKNVPLIAMAHEIPYVATATVADLRDLESKVEQAMDVPRRALPARARALPARVGRRRRSDTIRLARLATQTGLFPVFEAEHGEVTASRRSAGACRSTSTSRLQAPLRAPASATTAVRTWSHASRRRRPQHPSRFGAAGRRGERLKWRQPFAITLASARAAPTRPGSWRTERAVYVTGMPPAAHACPAGEDVQCLAVRRRGGRRRIRACLAGDHGRRTRSRR